MMEEKNGMAGRYTSCSVDAVCRWLLEPRNTLITCHVKPDGDCIFSAMALKLLLSCVGVRAYVVCAEELPGRLAFLAKEEQPSLLWESIPEDFRIERVIAVDTASPSQAGDLYARLEGKYDLMIDHHGRGTAFADYLIDKTASATGELIFRIAATWKKQGILPTLPRKVCQLLYAAISSDTGCFQYQNVTSETHLIAAELLRAEIDPAEINHRLFSTVPFLQKKAEFEAFRRLRRYADGKIAVIPFPFEVKEKLGFCDEYLETLIDVARVIEGVEIAVVVKQPNEENKFRISMRSSVDFDVSEVCAVFGGGGHVRAAGATVSEPEGIEKLVERILSEIRKRLPKTAVT